MDIGHMYMDQCTVSQLVQLILSQLNHPHVHALYRADSHTIHSSKGHITQNAVKSPE